MFYVSVRKSYRKKLYLISNRKKQYEQKITIRVCFYGHWVANRYCPKTEIEKAFWEYKFQQEGKYFTGRLLLGVAGGALVGRPLRKTAIGGRNPN